MIRCSKLHKAVREEGERDRETERETERERERDGVKGGGGNCVTIFNV